VHSTLPAGVGYTSIDLNVSYTRRVTRESGTLRAVGTVVKPGRRVAFSRAEILDQAGKVVASATSSCLIMPGADGSGALDAATSGCPSSLGVRGGRVGSGRTRPLDQANDD
jgi:hypothetical protein